MAAAREDTRGIWQARTKAKLPLAMQIQKLETQGIQRHTEETSRHLLCVILYPLWLKFPGAPSIRAIHFLFSSTLPSLIQRALPAQRPTAEARIELAPQIQDR